MINLRGIVKAALGIGFDVGAQITVAATYNRIGDATYTPADGEVSPNTVTIPGVSVMVLSFSAKEIDGERVRAGDERVLVRREEVAALPEPARDDYIVETVSGTRRDVISFRADPTRQLWDLHCRRNSG